MKLDAAFAEKCGKSADNVVFASKNLMAMGKEILCRGSLRGQTSDGKALLESDNVLFRGDFRCKLLFRDLVKVSVRGGTLILVGPEGELRLELGDRAAIWSDRILHPKSRAAKLGLTSGSQAAVINLRDAAFEKELSESGVASPASSRSKSLCDLLFLGAEQPGDLKQIVDLVPRLKDRGALWIVYPKGRADIPESAVIEAGRAAGLKDVKVVSFSVTQTALKFVRPLLR